MGDAAIGFLVANLLAALVSTVVLIAFGYVDADGTTGDIPIGMVALLQVPLWVGYLGAPILATRRKGNGVVRDLGLRMRWFDVFGGSGAGLATQLLLIPLLYLPISLFFDLDSLDEPARALADKATDPVGVVLLVLVVVVGAPLVEELFFRGLLLRSVQRRFGTAVAVISSSLIFGAVHLQLLQLPALTAFGVVAALLTVWTGRLGPAIWAHVAFNGVATAVLLLTD